MTAPWVLRRSLVWKNATKEEDKQTIAWINETLSNLDDLTEKERAIKDVLLADKSLASEAFGPIVDKFYQELVSSESDNIGELKDDSEIEPI